MRKRQPARNYTDSKHEHTWSKTRVQAIAAALDEIRAQHGTLTAELVVQEARKKSSVLHSLFEWDDKLAAEHYRISYASSIIRRIAIVRPDIDEPIKKWVFVRETEDDKEKTYQPVERVLKDKFMMDQVISTARTELVTWLATFGRYPDLSDCAEKIRAALASLK